MFRDTARSAYPDALASFQVVAEMARVDASLSTFLMVHTSLAMSTIGEWPFLATAF